MNSKFYFLLLFILLTPLFTFAQDPLYLVGIPGVDIGSDFNTYINALYKLSIAIAALLAVIKIIVAGLKWMLTDLITSKEDAKKDIQGAVLGLLIIIAAVIILETINPQLTKTQIFLAPAESIDMSEVSIQKKASDCVREYGSYAWDPVSNICNPGQATTTKKYGGFVREYNCKPINVEAGQYDCSEVEKTCRDLGGEVETYNALTGTPLNFKIQCTPKSKKWCEDNGRTWNDTTSTCNP